MRKWLIISTVLHLVLFLVLWLGFPRLPTPLPTPQKIIPVEITDLSKVTTAKSKPAPKPPKPEPPKPEPPKPPPPKPEVKPPSEAKPEPPKPAPPKPEEKPEPVPTPKPKPKPPEPKKEPPKADPLASVLKNVSKLKPQEKPPEETPPQKEPTPAQPSPQAPAIADRLTTSEEDALKRQLAQCWNVPIGARDVEKIAVQIAVLINADRTIREAVVVDQARMNTDPFFRTLAESALRALYNPRCSPLALPPEKYQEWQETIITFNPKDMF